MADKTKIEWTEATWNPIRGCTVVSEGCRNCYAMAVATRFSDAGQAYEGLAYRNASGAHWTGKVRLVEEHLEDPLRWKRARRIFVNSMSDLFHQSIPDDWIDRVFAVMALTPQHTFQILTKRPERMKLYTAALSGDRLLRTAFETGLVTPRADHIEAYAGIIAGQSWPLSNVWLGVSVENQETADKRIPLLLETPAAVRWISAEPLLGPIDLHQFTFQFSVCQVPSDGTTVQALRQMLHAAGKELARTQGSDLLDWVVVGGESGPGARPMHPDWVRSLRDQCVAAGVPLFFKQWGEYTLGSYLDGNKPATVRMNAQGQRPSKPSFNGYEWFKRVGKKEAGRRLDGREWSEYPA